MHLETSNLLYDGFETILDTMQEHPFDTEYNLPDYCTDIQKILKCIVSPEITQTSIVGDSLSVDGVADIRVLYLDAKGECVRGFDLRREFSFTRRLSGSTEGVTATVRPSVQHMTCRAMNARRVDIHVTLGFHVCATAVRRTELMEAVSTPEVETRCETFEASRALGCPSHTFILEKNMELQNGKPPVETVLCRHVHYAVEECTVRDGEIAVSGKALVTILYRTFSDSAMPEQMLCELPFSETVECAGAEADCAAQVRILGGECTVQPREDSVGEYMVLNVYLKPCLSVRVTKPCAVKTVCDAYATKGALSVKYKSVALERCEALRPRTIKVRDVLRIPEEDLERVLHVFADALTLSAFTEKEGAALRGKFNLCILYRTTDKRLVFLEHVFDFTESIEGATAGRYSATGEIGAVRFTITDGGAVEFTAEIYVQETMRNAYNVRVAEALEHEASTPDDDCRAAVYYAAAGERLWDIAKRYRAPMRCIQAQNDCTEETLSAERPLLICKG